MAVCYYHIVDCCAALVLKLDPGSSVRSTSAVVVVNVQMVKRYVVAGPEMKPCASQRLNILVRLVFSSRTCSGHLKVLEPPVHRSIPVM